MVDYSRVAELVEWLPTRVPSSVARIPRFLRLFQHGSLEAFYAPADYENRKARVAIIGLTPGWQQARSASLRPNVLNGSLGKTGSKEGAGSAGFRIHRVRMDAASVSSTSGEAG